MAKKVAQLSVIIALSAALCLSAQPAHAGTTIVVNAVAPARDMCTLVEAVQAANTDHQVGGCAAGSGADLITFNIGDFGSAHTLTVTAPLEITQPVTIDGTTEPGFSGQPLIRVDGGNSAANGFVFLSGAAQGSDSILKGLMVTGFINAQVKIATGNAFTHIVVAGNELGNDGSSAFGGSYGIYILGGQYAVVGGTTAAERNIIAGNANEVVLAGDTVTSADNNIIQGNYIGLNAAGTAPLGGPGTDVLLTENTLGASSNRIVGNAIAGSETGISIAGANCDNNIIRSNRIGTNAAGTADIGVTTTFGIKLHDGDGTIVGGTGTGDGNVLSGGYMGISVEVEATNTKIFGNRIGTNADGTAAIPNAYAGIFLVGTPVNIGDAITPGNNLISGNGVPDALGVGIAVLAAGSAGTTIFGNKIGTTLDGTGSLPNYMGVYLYSEGSARISENVIANNAWYGINIETGSSLASGASPNRLNCITGNPSAGVYNQSAEVDLRGNWWGNATGPTSPLNLGGTGDWASGAQFVPFLVSPAASCGNGGGIYDGPHSAWTYAGAWMSYPVAGLYNDTLQLGQAVGGTASLTFHGTGFSLDYLTLPGFGNIGIYLDGSPTPLSTINTNAAVALLTYTSPELIPGTHTVVLKHAGPTGTMIAFDSLKVKPVGAVRPDSAYDPADPPWSYTGTWASVAVPGLYNGTLHVALTPGGTATLFFTGTGFHLEYLTYPGWGGFVVLVDGVVAQVINTNAPVGLGAYDSAELPSGPHSVLLYYYGPVGKYIGIDWIQILPSL